MAIFVVEDDAQNGSDHVDAHRTVALAISPYIKRHSVDSTMYSTSSMLRTMELILGLEPMSQFDAAARPMFASFTPQADLDRLRPPPGPGRPQRQEPAARPHGRALAAAQPRDRGPRRRPALQRDHLEGRPRRRFAHAAAGPRGVRDAEVAASERDCCLAQGYGGSLERFDRVGLRPRVNRRMTRALCYHQGQRGKGVRRRV